jgi:hypothetical protein
MLVKRKRSEWKGVVGLSWNVDVATFFLTV